MIGHVVLEFIRQGIGRRGSRDSRIPTNQLQGTFTPGRNVITGETAGQMASRLQSGTMQHILNRGVISKTPPVVTKPAERNIVTTGPTTKRTTGLKLR